MIDLKRNDIRTRPPLSESINKNLEASSSKEVLKEMQKKKQTKNRFSKRKEGKNNLNNFFYKFSEHSL